MYKFQNGILHKDGKAVFGLGVSYYASYFPTKVPVPEDKDRIGEMKKDIELIKKAGLNIVRTAALGSVNRTEDDIVCETPFIDSMMEEAQKQDIAMMVRLQGYTMNISGYENYKPIRHDGQEVESDRWNAFIQHSLHHKGILKDNKEGTQALTKHFSKYDNFVSFHVYNEPHYPGGGIYDYHPDAIDAYRLWLIKNGIMRVEEANDYTPPKRRPNQGEKVDEWINWRLFCLESLSDFLNNTHIYSKAVNPKLEGVTSLTSATFELGNANRGVDTFAVAKGMDISGVTMYPRCRGLDYFVNSMKLDGLESAASVHGKHAWIIEYDARTNISKSDFYMENYLAAGSGIKGIIYYQWRGDHIFGNAPEENAFGIVNCDGTKTKSYNEILKFIEFFNKYSDEFVNAERLTCEVAILYSHHTNFYYDGLTEKEGYFCVNPYMDSMQKVYTDLTKKYLGVRIIQADQLMEQDTIKAVYVPHFYYGLSEHEKEVLKAFSKKGGNVFLECAGGYDELGRNCNGMLDTSYNGKRQLTETLDIAGAKPAVWIEGSEFLMCKVLKGNDYYILCLNNIDTLERGIKHAVARCDFEVLSAILITPDVETEILVENNAIFLPEIYDGAFVLVKMIESGANYA